MTIFPRIVLLFNISHSVLLCIVFVFFEFCVVISIRFKPQQVVDMADNDFCIYITKPNCTGSAHILLSAVTSNPETSTNWTCSKK